MLTGINKVFSSVRGKLKDLMRVEEPVKTEQSAKEAIMNPDQEVKSYEESDVKYAETSGSAVQEVLEENKRVQERRKRIQERNYTYRLNRNDRRFLKAITGETYPTGSRTNREMYGRVQFLKNIKISKEKKRAVALKYLTTGQV